MIIEVCWMHEDDKVMPLTGTYDMEHMVTTMDDKGKKALSGSMMKRQMPEQQGITNYFDVKSVQEYSANVEQLGSKVISPKMPVLSPAFAACTDTGNNGFGILEADNTAK